MKKAKASKPKKNPLKLNDTVLSVKVDNKTRNKIRKAAETKGLTMSTYARMLILQNMELVV